MLVQKIGVIGDLLDHRRDLFGVNLGLDVFLEVTHQRFIGGIVPDHRRQLTAQHQVCCIRSIDTAKLTDFHIKCGIDKFIGKCGRTGENITLGQRMAGLGDGIYEFNFMLYNSINPSDFTYDH